MISDSNLKVMPVLYPASMDTVWQLDKTAFLQPDFFEYLLKMSLLFSPVLVLNDAQLLLHQSIRKLFLLANQKYTPGSVRGLFDLLKTPMPIEGIRFAPVVIITEDDPSDRNRMVPLQELLTYKLAIAGIRKEKSKPPVEVLSLWDQNINVKLRQAWERRDTQQMYSLFYQSNGCDATEYDSFMDIARTIWEDNHNISRVPYFFPDTGYPKRLKDMTVELWDVPDSLKGTREELISWLGDDGSGATRSMIRDWLRERHALNGLLGQLTNAAYYDNLLKNFPSDNTYAASHENSALGAIISLANVPTHMRKPIPEIIGDVVEEELALRHGPLPLKSLDFLFIQSLREIPQFRRSLANLHKGWLAQRSQYDLGQDIKDHLKLIYEEALAKNVVTGEKPTVAKIFVRFAAAATPGAIAGTELGIQLSPQSGNPVYAVLGGIAVGAISGACAVHNFVSHESKDLKSFHELATRIIKKVPGDRIK